MDSQIPFFCGDSVDCRTVGSATALKQALQNVETKFVMVGVLEILDKSLEVMQCRMPKFFKVSKVQS